MGSKIIIKNKMRLINERVDELVIINPDGDINESLGIEISTDDENRHFVSKLRENSQAQKSGMELDREITRINGINVRYESHDRVCNLIKCFKGSQIAFTLLRNESVNNDTKIKNNLPEIRNYASKSKNEVNKEEKDFKE